MIIRSLLNLDKNKKGLLIQLEGEDQPKRRSNAELSEYFNMKFIQGVFCTEANYKLISRLLPEFRRQEAVEATEEYFQCYKPKVREFLAKQPDYLEVRWVNKEVGYATFARCDISKDTIVGVLSGELHFHEKNRKVSDYGAGIGEYSSGVLSLDCENCGDVNRFTTHLPSEEDKLHAPEVLTANIGYQPLIVDGVPLILHRAKRNIRAGELIGEDYGSDFWDGRYIKPYLFVRSSHQSSLVHLYRFDSTTKMYQRDEKNSINLKPSSEFESETKLAMMESLKASSKVGESKKLSDVSKVAAASGTSRALTNFKTINGLSMQVKEYFDSKVSLVDLKIPFSSKKSLDLPCEIINGYLDSETKKVVAQTQQFGFFRENRFAAVHDELRLKYNTVLKKVRL